MSKHIKPQNNIASKTSSMLVTLGGRNCHEYTQRVKQNPSTVCSCTVTNG